MGETNGCYEGDVEWRDQGSASETRASNKFGHGKEIEPFEIDIAGLYQRGGGAWLEG